ncbi:MAG: HlyC/CorC family transporter [bacterium]|nr:HlyC/CorC family transporter [bacterium]
MDLLLLFFLLIFSAAFSGSETAFFSLGSVEQAKLEREGSATGRRVAAMLKKSHDLLSALLIGNLLVNTAASVVATSLCMQWFGANGVAVAVPVVTVLLLLFGEITPKMLALRFRKSVVILAQPVLQLWVWLNWPLLKILALLVRFVLKAVPLKNVGSRPLDTDQLQVACDLAVADGTLSETEGLSLGRLLRLEDLEVVQVMTPRTTAITLRQDMDLRQVLATARRAGFNRYPVMKEGEDIPIGFFHMKDLLGRSEKQLDQPLKNGLRKLLFVPESKDVAALLAEMRHGGAHLVGVVDEHGDFTGIVTMADCLQALLGPVMDSTLHSGPLISLGNSSWAISGRCDMRELQEISGMVLPEHKDYRTVAGFMMARLGRILKEGDVLELSEGNLTVLEMDGHRVERIQLILFPDAGPKAVSS